MGSLLGFRPPQFSEDIAWLPGWLQPYPYADHINGGQTPSEQMFEELPFLQQNTSTGEYANLSEEGRYRSCNLFLSGEDNSPVSFTPSSGNVVQFHLHLSLDGDSENTPSPLPDTSQDERFESKDSLGMQRLQTSFVPEEKIYQVKVDHNASLINLVPTPQQEKTEYGQFLSNNKDKGMMREENVSSRKVIDINDAVELSIAASEALLIHEVIKTGSATKYLPASSVLEVALRVKQARLEGFEETFHCSTEEDTEIDYLSNVDESIMADAYEDVGLCVTGPGDLCGCNSMISQVEDTYASENHRSDEKLKFEGLGALEVDSGDISTKQQLKDITDIIHLKKDLALETFGADRQKKPIDDPALGLETVRMACDVETMACDVETMLLWSVQANSDISFITKVGLQKLDFGIGDLTSFQATLNSSPRTMSSEKTEIDHNQTNIVPDKFQSRWLGGWTWKKGVNDSAPMEHNNARSVPKYFVGETSFLSESADMAPDENSFVQKQDKESNIVSQSSVPFEGLCNKTSEELLFSKDITSSPSPSFVDPLCSVVPCSISSENLYSTLAQNQMDKADVRKCFVPTREHNMDNLQKTSALNIEFVRGEGIAVPVINSNSSQPTVRRKVTSLRTYSRLFPGHGAYSAKERIYCDQSFPLKCDVKLLSSVVQNPVTKLTNEMRNYDETAKDEAELCINMQEKMSSSLILNRGTHQNFQASKSFSHNFAGEENLERTAVTERELTQCENLQKAETKCKNPQVPQRKRVHFAEAEISLPRKRKLPMKLQVETTYRNCSTARTGKRSKRCLTKCSDKDWKRLIFQNLEFLLTGFSGKKEKEVEGLIRKYGGMVLSDIPSPNSRGKRSSRCKAHLLPVILSFKKLRTTEFLYGCAVNACILKINWLTDSIAAGYVLPPSKYMILPNHVGEKCTRIGKPFRCNNYIFDSVGIMFHGMPNFCTKMAKIVKHGGGLVFRTLQWLVQSLDNEKIRVGAVVTEDERRVSRHLKHCASERKIPMMGASWLVNSLYVGKLLPFIENNPSSASLPIKLADNPVSLDFSEEI